MSSLFDMWKNILVWAFFCLSGTLAIQERVQISVYYESLCPDSVAFLVNQFYPSYKIRETQMTVTLVPYGKANTTKNESSYEFECQHGDGECYGNKVQSCVIDLYPVNQSVEFVYCAMKSGNASDDTNLEECATSTNLSWHDIQECITTGRADQLLAENGKRTAELIPDVTNFIPVIVFGDVYSVQLHMLSIVDFIDLASFIIEQVHCDFCQFSGAEVVFGSGKFVFGVALLLIMLQNMIV